MRLLKKAVTRRSDELMRDRSKYRRIVVTLYPAGFIGLRLERCRREGPFDPRGLRDRRPDTRHVRACGAPERQALPRQALAPSEASRLKVRGRPEVK